MRQICFRALGMVGWFGLCVVGCNSESGPAVTQRPIDSVEATTTTNQRVDDVLTGLAETTASLDTTDSIAVASDGLNGALGNSGCDSGSTTTSSSTASASSVDSVPKSTTDSLDRVLHDLANEAKTHVFRQEFVESEDGHQVTYKVDPTAACAERTQCIDQLIQNPLRFVVTANNDDTLNVSMLVGQDRHNPASAVLGSNKLSVRGNLAEVMDALKLYLSADDQKDLPEKLAGSVEWSIEKRAPNDFAISSAILEKFELLTGQATGKAVAVTVQPSSPASEITINSATNTIGYRENLGAMDVQAAGNAVCSKNMKCGSQEQSGTFGLHLAGLTGEFAAQAGASELTFSGLGLGPDSSYLGLNGDRLVSLDLNPTAGRKFSVNFKKTSDGTLVTFEPALDLQIALAMNRLSESMRADLPEWLMDEVFDVMLGGAPKPAILVPAKSCGASNSPTVKQQLKVVSGVLTLDSSSLGNPVEVAAGMCLVPVQDTAADASAGTASAADPFSRLASDVCQ